MRQIVRTALLIIAVGTGACSKDADAPVLPAEPAATSAPAAPQPAPLTSAQAARLVRMHSPVMGPADAPVTVVEFLDPACEACRSFAPIVKQILFLHSADVRVVVRYAAFHRGSDEAIRMLEAARRQGKFEVVLQELFNRQPEWADHQAPDLERAWEIAGAAGLDLARARRDASDAQSTAVLRIDEEDVVALKVESTPTFFVNGKLLQPFGSDALMNRVSDEVESARDDPKS